MSRTQANLSKLYGSQNPKPRRFSLYNNFHYKLHFLTIFISLKHASFSNSTSLWTIYLGRETQSGPNVNEVNRTVSQIIVHPKWNNTWFNNDIALMKLNSSVNFTDYIRPICLASNSSQFPNGTNCYSTGWGKLSNTSECASLIIDSNSFNILLIQLLHNYLVVNYSICKMLTH